METILGGLAFAGVIAAICPVKRDVKTKVMRRVDYSGCIFPRLSLCITILLADCTSEPIGKDASTSNHDASLLVILIIFGWVSISEQFLKAMAA